MNLEKRKNNRIVLSIPARYKLFNLDNLEKDVREEALKSKSKVRNLSLGGVQLVSDKAFQPGAVLELELAMPGVQPVRTVAKVVWCRPSPPPSEKEFNLGIQFIPVYEEDLMKLKEYLSAGG